ncbi:MAG TPA: hypothetical protein EYP56_18965, partial [Planctomycetaceae bacterium]|nr:hypothetical protein [Planctomycetaceae bacterium]
MIEMCQIALELRRWPRHTNQAAAVARVMTHRYLVRSTEGTQVGGIVVGLEYALAEALRWVSTHPT